MTSVMMLFFFSSRRRHTRFDCDWSSGVCSSDLLQVGGGIRSSATIDDLLQQGVSRVVIGSTAVERPDEVSEWLVRYRTVERGVGEEGRFRWGADHLKKKRSVEGRPGEFHNNQEF